jgi:tetratricopeptide (TPR) repeat protein
MANYWAMAGFLPFFLLALLRLRGLSLFNFHSHRRRDQPGSQGAAPVVAATSRPLLRLTKSGDGFKVDVGQVAAELRFLLRMTLLGLAGLSLFLVLPLVQTFSPDSASSFWQALHAAVSSQAAIQVFFGRFLRHNRDVALLLAAVSLLPVLVLSIRWSAAALAASNSRTTDLALLLFHLAHAFLLLICVWTVFDPPFSPRQIGLRFGLPATFLPLYYLAALSIGYYSGFLLLLSGAAARQRLRRSNLIRRAACWAVPKLVYLLVGLTVAGLVLKNAPAIRAGSAQYLEHYARLAAGSLPPEGAVVLSDDPGRLEVLQAALARAGKAERYLTVVTRALPSAKYRGWLGRKYPGRWPEPNAEVKAASGTPAASVTNASLDAMGVVRLVSRLAQSNHVYCVDPGIGLMLEQFELQPHGLLNEMRFYPVNSLSRPPPGSEELAQNEAFWKHAIETGVNPLLPLVARPQIPRPDFEKRLMDLAHLQTPPPAQAEVLARRYSSALNRWGVALQRNGRLSEATPCFDLAQQLNAANLPARVNLQCNSNLLAHQKMTVVRDQSFREQLDSYLARNQVLVENGPFDEPSYCYHLGLSLAGAGMMRQAGQQFDRVKALAPGDVAARLMLGQVLCGWNPDRALQVAAQIRTDPDLPPLGPTNEVEVALLEARAWFVKTNSTKAEAIITSLLASYPENAALLDRAGALFQDYGGFSNALRIVERQLQSTPDNFAALVNKGRLLILSGDFSNAIPPLTRSLAVTNTYAARLDRAYAYLRIGRLDAAEADYQELLRAFPTAYRASFWLGDIAWQKKDTNAAIRYYRHYLSNTVARTTESRAAAARLKSLQQVRD